jgi:hypothetical protein
LSHTGHIYEKREPGPNPGSLSLLRLRRRGDPNTHGFPPRTKPDAAPPDSGDYGSPAFRSPSIVRSLSDGFL